MNKRKAFLLVNILVPLIAGATVYYLISPDVIFVKGIDSLTGINIHINVTACSSGLIRFIRNYMPDMLWGYSLIFVLFLLFDNNTAGLMRIFIIAAGFSAAMELLQLTSMVSGTFDLSDIAAEFLAELAAVLIIKIRYARGDKKRYEEKL